MDQELTGGNAQDYCCGGERQGFFITRVNVRSGGGGHQMCNLLIQLFETRERQKIPLFTNCSQLIWTKSAQSPIDFRVDREPSLTHFAALIAWPTAIACVRDVHDLPMNVVRSPAAPLHAAELTNRALISPIPPRET